MKDQRLPKGKTTADLAREFMRFKSMYSKLLKAKTHYKQSA